MTKYYRTRLEFTWDDSQYKDGDFTPQKLEPVVTEWLAQHGFDPNTTHDFDASVDEPFSYGFTGMTSDQLIALLVHIASAFPDVHFYARGAGESFGDMWLREFHKGKTIFSAGPYQTDNQEIEKKRGWFDRLFR
ncbi:hypothetical protein [Neisseria wadsworthii]|uniref:Uncharacterized protein n=1 Tax=Neisseria wadsworthii 9715 TaxID=1030841 RepID=G4CPD4_9NEIS|nr:hypothetical protein [Neisseria wadsworthii]EGZ48048.1 hypothetical protein HMPREF9370_0944 [Neisseria wadsworthii 9715]QMT34760.1 hypothetical protein H3L96_06575 [Neisseria wadsworthii]